MSDEERIRSLELRIAAALDTQAFAEAARTTIEGYGPEILGFLVAIQRNESDAKDVFSQFCEDLWRSMPTFRRAATMRTWSYKLARHALARFARDPYRHRGRRLETDEYSGLVDRVSSQISTERSHDRLDKARATLDPDDQALLILRVDRKLAWNEITEVLADTGSSEALRKRYERIKARLRQLMAG